MDAQTADAGQIEASRPGIGLRSQRPEAMTLPPESVDARLADIQKKACQYFEYEANPVNGLI